jgi:hypothetical protein
MDTNKYELMAAQENAAAWMKRAAEQLERAAAEMRRYALDFGDACEIGHQKEATKVIGWAVNGALNVLPNLRLDMAPNLAAEMALAVEKQGA